MSAMVGAQLARSESEAWVTRSSKWRGSRGSIQRRGVAVGPTFAAQARQAFENLRMVLEAGGSGLDLVVNTTVIVADASEFGVVNELFAEYFAASPPARMTMQVTIPKGLLISIGCVAMLRE
jgi:2-iminobutanoate/2-iminopropanoate deaminase